MMKDNVQDGVILATIALLGISSGFLLWLCLGPLGFAGLAAGYGVGLSIYFAPFPET
ncbi:MAG: hypothetical protein HC771_22940 [Synechococcales cyanobacterium CRU_2_2]|nr:hypothetical protein [Synechococcales cyanobacterium CRU_2_2]